MSAIAETPKNIGHAPIASLAYQLWDLQGRPLGRDLDFWLDAEARLRAGSKRVPARRNDNDPNEDGPLPPSTQAYSPARPQQLSVKAKAKPRATAGRR